MGEIHVKREQQAREQKGSPSPHSVTQYQFTFGDVGVILDVSRLLLGVVRTSTSYSSADRQRMESFAHDFVPTFFGIAADRFEAAVRPRSRAASPPADEEMPDADASAAESSASRGRAAKRTDLLRDVFHRGRNGKPMPQEGESMVPSGSKETTPDISSVANDDAEGAADESKAESLTATETNDGDWIGRPGVGAARKTQPVRLDFRANEPYHRHTYSLYCGTNIYCFLRLFQIVYERLVAVKRREKSVAEDVRRAKLFRPAEDLSMVHKPLGEYFADVGPDANYYEQVVNLFQDVLEQRTEAVQFEDVLRRFYLHAGWPLYSYERFFAALSRFALNSVSSDAKDKSADIIQLYYKDREKERTTHEAEISYRRQVEKMIRDGDVFRINYVSSWFTLSFIRTLRDGC